MKRIDFLKAGAGIVVSGGLTGMAADGELVLPLILPVGLERGDLIGITAPAGCVWNVSHVDKIVAVLHNEGFKTEVGKTVYEQVGYLAGSDEMRAEELMYFFQKPSVKCILTMRGGWGCARILERLDYSMIKNNPKIIMGFSDITSLLLAIYAKTGLVTFHGPCGYSSWGDFTLEAAKKAVVHGGPFLMENPADNKDQLKTYKSGKAKGKLIGGNLAVLVSLIGTPYLPKMDNCLLFLEEIGEEPYRIDRMLWQLKQAGIFDLVSGVILGAFTDCVPTEPERSFTLDEVFSQHFATASFPVYVGASFGHLAPKFTLPIGVLAEMDADNFSIKTLVSCLLIGR